MKIVRRVDLDELRQNAAAIFTAVASRNEVVIVESEGKKVKLELIESAPAAQLAGNTLSEEEAAAALKVVADLKKQRAQMVNRRGGEPFAESWEDIRKDREERSQKWL
jgi:hypothetical protein